MKKVITLFFFATLLLVSCKSSKNTSSSAALDSSSNVASVEKWIIANEKVKCSADTENLCYQVKKGTSMDYELIDAEIIGFTYEAGYKYQLEIKITNHKKTGTQYSLVKELFKVPMK